MEVSTLYRLNHFKSFNDFDPSKSSLVTTVLFRYDSMVLLVPWVTLRLMLQFKNVQIQKIRLTNNLN